MNAQTIVTPAGDRMVVLPEAEYQALVEASEDASDAEAVRRFDAALAQNEEELVPDEVVGRLLAGESPIRVWREHRGMSLADLALAANISRPYLSQLEGGSRQGQIEVLKAISEALSVMIDDLV